MRTISLFKKTLIENLRDWKILILTLTFAPFFVVLMYFYAEGSGRSPYRLVIINHDLAASTAGLSDFHAGLDLILELHNAKDPDGIKIFDVSQETSLETARKRLADGSVDLLVEIPGDFSRVLLAYRQGEQPSPAVVRTFGDPANARYLMAAVWSDMLTYEYTASVTGMRTPLEIQVETVSGIKTLNDFELYVPALVAMAFMMLMFTAAASLIKEKDRGTIVRLRLSNMTVFEWLVAVSLVQVIIGILALALTYGSAVALGYRSDGSMLAVLVVGLLACLSVIGISLIVAAYLRTIFDLLTIGCFPFFILMFFSGGMFPLPPMRLFTLGARSFSINDLLPTTHAITALGRILNQGASLGEIRFELVAISLLTVVFYALGVWLFTRRQMQAED